MRLPVRLLAAAGTAAVLSACSSPVVAVPPDPADVLDDGGDVAADPDTADVPVLEHDSPVVVVPAEGTTDGTFVRAFETAVAGDGATLVVTFWGGVAPCSVLDHVEVHEYDTEVAVALHEGYVAGESGAPPTCIALAEVKQVVVELDAPLGDRAVVDLGKQVPSEEPDAPAGR